MKLNVAVQMDPIARINIRGDSTFALMLEAQKRGHDLSYFTPDQLSLRGEELVAPVQVVTVRDEAGNHFTLGEPRRAPLNAFDVSCFGRRRRSIWLHHPTHLWTDPSQDDGRPDPPRVNAPERCSC